MQLSTLIEHIKTLDTSDLIGIHNQYCDNNNDPDGTIYGNDEDFFMTFFQSKSYEVARSTFYGDYNFSHEYVRFNGYGNLETLDDFTPEDFPVSLDTIATDIIDNPRAYDHIIDLDDIIDDEDITKKSIYATLVLESMDKDIGYQDSLDNVLKLFPLVDKGTLEKELEQYI